MGQVVFQPTSRYGPSHGQAHVPGGNTSCIPPSQPSQQGNMNTSDKTIQHMIFHRARLHSILSRIGFSCQLLLLMGSETTSYSASWQCLQTPAGPAPCPCFLEILLSSTSQLSCMTVGWQPSQEGDRSFSRHTLGH